MANTRRTTRTPRRTTQASPPPELQPVLTEVEPPDANVALPAILNELRLVQEQRIFLIAQVADLTAKLRAANARIGELETAQSQAQTGS